MLKEVMIKLLNQKLKLEMLIPCDKKGKILEEPVNYSAYEVKMSAKDFGFNFIDCEEYEQAKEKVLFKGFKISVEKNAIINNEKTIIRIHENNNFSLNGKQIITIEDLIKEETKENANLISKAPEMLEALQFFVNNNMLSVIGEEVAERLINEILE